MATRAIDTDVSSAVTIVWSEACGGLATATGIDRLMVIDVPEL